MPVGAIYLSVDGTNPATLFGGTWEQIKDKFLLCSGNTYSNGSTGGASSTKILEKNIPNLPVWANYLPSGNFSHSKNDTYSQIVHFGLQGTETNAYPADTTGVWPTNGTKYGNRGYDLHVGVNDSEAINNMPPYLAVTVWKRVN